MIDPVHVPALRQLGRLWLEELRSEDLPRLAALPELTDSLSGAGSADLTALAAEHQRLFGFNLPPYESVFLDPSGMLDAPATERLKALLQEAGWAPPAGPRAAAVDHLGLEMLALADLVAGGQVALAERLLTEHLALWAPLCLAALRRLRPHPFYQTLGALSLGVLLNALPGGVAAPRLPDLPPAPRYAGSPDGGRQPVAEVPDWAVPLPAGGVGALDEGPSLTEVVDALLLPRASGIYITRRDIAAIAHDLGLGAPAGERRRMLEGLLRGAGGLGLADPVLRALDGLLAAEADTLAAWSEAWPAWAAAGALWRERLAGQRAVLAEGFVV